MTCIAMQPLITSCCYEGMRMLHAHAVRPAQLRRPRDGAAGTTTPTVRLKLTLIQLQAELIEEGILLAKGVYSEAVYQVIQGSLCEKNEEAKEILKKTKAWW